MVQLSASQNVDNAARTPNVCLISSFTKLDWELKKVDAPKRKAWVGIKQ
jgi:hypothetical protein